MKPSSKNEVMNGIVNAYIAQKVMDKANNTHYADTWKILNGADDEIDASLKFDLSEVEWSDVKAHLKANNIAFTLALISYKDGHSQNSFVWYDNEHIYATEMNEIGSVVFHVVDNANKEMLKPTDETSSSILKMLLALENGGANGGGGSGDSANWINYHIEIKAGGPVTIKDPIDFRDYDIFQLYIDAGNAFDIVASSTAPGNSDNISKSCEISKDSKVYSPALSINYFAKVDKQNKIIRIYNRKSISSDKNVWLKYKNTYFKWCFKNSSLIMPGDYTLTVTYGIGIDNIGIDGLYHITSDLNNTKIHMIVEEDTAGNKTIKGAEGENGLIHEYVPALGNSYYLYLVDVQLAPGWTN